MLKQTITEILKDRIKTLEEENLQLEKKNLYHDQLMLVGLSTQKFFEDIQNYLIVLQAHNQMIQSLSKSIVEQHQENISVTCNPTVFTIELPISVEQ